MNARPFSWVRLRRDHVSAAQRMAASQPIICLQQPSWITELLCLLAVVELVALLMAVGEISLARQQAAVSRDVADFWMEAALTPESAPMVKLSRDGVGFRCSSFNVRREWERAIAAKCQEMGGMLIQARTTE